MRLIYLLLLFGVSLQIVAQPTADYFQQQVDVRIDVTLSDEDHTLDGNISMVYTNNSPDALDVIYMHLWANAYKNRTTAFAKQKIEQGDTKFYFAEAKELGNFGKLDFTVDGAPVKWAYDPSHVDIAILKLNEPLASGATITISTPFLLTIPSSFSRLGHVGQSYQLTQWYPKPAVYDNEGWHPMPYLDMGEFYSEFGDYEVNITLPQNYVVGATGEVQDERERAFLAKKATETAAYLSQITSEKSANLSQRKFSAFPPSSKEMKTLHFKAERVHDFAWFADKRFMVQKSQVAMPSGRMIDTWTMFTETEQELWKKSIDYVNRSVAFYSDLVGEYPYPQATAVQSALSAGGGMEYPMITVIGLSGNAQALDEVITHEVGHNWFYGILGFNERDHVWLDEGINSYYDHRYTKRYYPSEGTNFLPQFFRSTSDMSLLEAGYIFQARRYRHQAPATHSEDYVPINYWLGGYEMPAVIFGHLEAYWGAEKFDPIMRDFYAAWKFKHPQPTDVQQFLERASGENLGWLFDDFIRSNKVLDYKMSNVVVRDGTYRVTVDNVGDIAAPFPISGIKNGSVVRTQWYKGTNARQVVDFPKGEYDELVIDADRVMLSVDWRNNGYLLKADKKKASPLKLRLLSRLENRKERHLYYAPAIAWNNYDKTLLGVSLHNLSLTSKRFEFLLTPMYSIASGGFSGLGGLRYNHFFRTGALESLRLSIGGRTFNYSYDFDYKDYDRYYKLAPKIELQFRNNKNKNGWSNRLSYRFVQIWQDYVRGIDFAAREFTREQQDYAISEFRHILKKSNGLRSVELNTAVHLGKSFSNIFTNYDQRFTYDERGNSLRLHGFAGWFPTRDTPVANARFLISGITGTGIFQRDYMFDELLLGRNDNRGIWSNQIFDRDANLKTISNIGSSTDWMLGLGASIDIPIGIPLYLYGDLAVYPDLFDDGLNSTYSLGVAIPIVRNIFEIYLPLYNSRDIREGVKFVERASDNPLATYFRRIAFKLDLRKVNPVQFRDDLSL